MVLTESTTHSHLYLALSALLLLSLFIAFIYLIKKRSNIDADDVWIHTFRDAGIADSDIGQITHDDHVWYYKDRSTCIGYGDVEEECPAYENYCAGGTSNGTLYTYGSLKQQALAIKQAILAGGQHEECPLIYNDDT